MKEVQAPNSYEWERVGERLIFFAGSIEMGEADNWQERLKNDLSDLSGVILNPRREDWDSSWEQKVTNPNFYEQVDWEHQGLMDADIIVFYFDPNTKSPITLMELGLMAGMSDKLLFCCCPDGFWRKGNVEYICDKYNIPLFNDYETFVKDLRLVCENGY